MHREDTNAMDTMFYHGTVIPGLDTIKANAKSHATGMPVAYFTEDRCYALACCRNRNENFVTMGIRTDGSSIILSAFQTSWKFSTRESGVIFTALNPRMG